MGHLSSRLRDVAWIVGDASGCHRCLYSEKNHRKRSRSVSWRLTVVLVSDRSAAVLKAGGGAAVKEQCVADTQDSVGHEGETETLSPLCRLRGPACHRPPLRRSRCGAVVHIVLILCLLCSGFGSCEALCFVLVFECCERSCVWFSRSAPDYCCLWGHLLFIFSSSSPTWSLSHGLRIALLAVPLHDVVPQSIP